MATQSEVGDLLNLARCFECVPSRASLEINTYLIAYASSDLTAAELEEASKCFRCLGMKGLLNAFAYLLASIAGTSTDVDALVERSKCYDCVSLKDLRSIQTYLLTLDPGGPGIEDPSDLMAAATDYRDMTPLQLLAIQVYLLAGNAGVSQTDPDVVAELAKCFECLPFPVLSSVITKIIEIVEIGDEGEGGGGVVGCTDSWEHQDAALTGHWNAVSGVLESIDIVIEEVCCNPLEIRVYECWNPDGTSASLYDTIPIPAAEAGAHFYATSVSVAGQTRPYFYAVQVCADGTISELSNIIWNGDPVVGAAAAADWDTRVQANGGAAISAANLAVVARFYSELQGWGLNTSSIFHTLNLLVGENDTAAFTPQIVGAGSDPYTWGNATGPGFGSWNVDRDGLKPITCWILPGIDTDVELSLTNVGLTMMVHNTESSNTAFDSYITDNAARHFGLQSNFAATCRFFCWDDAGAGLYAGALPYNNWRGLFSVNRLSGSTGAGYIVNTNTAQSSIFTVTGSAGSRPLIDTRFGYGASGSAVTGAGALRRYSFFAVHIGLTSSQVAFLHNAIRVARMGLQGGYVESNTNPSGFESITENYNLRVIANGGATVAGARLNALDTFWAALVTAGIHTKMRMINAFLPDSLTAAITPYLRFMGYEMWTNTGPFLAADLTVNGLKSNSSKWLSTGVCANSLFLSKDNVGVTVYSYDAVDGFPCYLDDAVAAGNAVGIYSSGGSLFFSASADNGGGLIGGALPQTTGYFSANRTANNAAAIYHASSTSAHASFVSSAVAGTGALWSDGGNEFMPVFARVVAGAASGGSNSRLSFVAFHDALTATESLAFYNAIQALRTAFGGGYV